LELSHFVQRYAEFQKPVSPLATGAGNAVENRRALPASSIELSRAKAVICECLAGHFALSHVPDSDLRYLASLVGLDRLMWLSESQY